MRARLSYILLAGAIVLWHALAPHAIAEPPPGSEKRSSQSNGNPGQLKKPVRISIEYAPDYSGPDTYGIHDQGAGHASWIQISPNSDDETAVDFSGGSSFLGVPHPTPIAFDKAISDLKPGLWQALKELGGSRPDSFAKDWTIRGAAGDRHNAHIDKWTLVIRPDPKQKMKSPEIVGLRAQARFIGARDEHTSVEVWIPDGTFKNKSLNYRTPPERSAGLSIPKIETKVYSRLASLLNDLSSAKKQKKTDLLELRELLEDIYGGAAKLREQFQFASPLHTLGQTELQSLAEDIAHLNKPREYLTSAVRIRPFRNSDIYTSRHYDLAQADVTLPAPKGAHLFQRKQTEGGKNFVQLTSIWGEDQANIRDLEPGRWENLGGSVARVTDDNLEIREPGPVMQMELESLYGEQSKGRETLWNFIHNIENSKISAERSEPTAKPVGWEKYASFANVAVIGDKPVGWYRYTNSSEGMRLDVFSVLPEYQGQGIGKTMLYAILEKLIETDQGRVRYVSRNETDHHPYFIEHMGFVPDEYQPKKSETLWTLPREKAKELLANRPTTVEIEPGTEQIRNVIIRDDQTEKQFSPGAVELSESGTGDLLDGTKRLHTSKQIPSEVTNFLSQWPLEAIWKNLPVRIGQDDSAREGRLLRILFDISDPEKEPGVHFVVEDEQGVQIAHTKDVRQIKGASPLPASPRQSIADLCAHLRELARKDSK